MLSPHNDAVSAQAPASAVAQRIEEQQGLAAARSTNVAPDNPKYKLPIPLNSSHPMAAAYTVTAPDGGNPKYKLPIPLNSTQPSAEAVNATVHPGGNSSLSNASQALNSSHSLAAAYTVTAPDGGNPKYKLPIPLKSTQASVEAVNATVHPAGNSTYLPHYAITHPSVGADSVSATSGNSILSHLIHHGSVLTCMHTCHDFHEYLHIEIIWGSLLTIEISSFHHLIHGKPHYCFSK